LPRPEHTRIRAWASIAPDNDFLLAAGLCFKAFADEGGMTCEEAGQSYPRAIQVTATGRWHCIHAAGDMPACTNNIFFASP